MNDSRRNRAVTMVATVARLVVEALEGPLRRQATLPILGCCALLLVTAPGAAWGQSIPSRVTLYPTNEDSHARQGDHVDLNFGEAVAISGATAAIGIPYDIEEQVGPGPGRVGIYSKTDAGWIRTATLLPSNVDDVRFGMDLALCGDLLIARAESSTYVFRGRGAQWQEIQRITFSSPNESIAALVCATDSFALGVSRLDDLGERRSTVDVYEPVCSPEFARVAQLRTSNPDDSIGDTLAMERGILVAGSRPDGVYVFERRGDRWIETEKLQGFGANGAGIGGAVAIRDRIIVAGAPGVEVSTQPGFIQSGDAFVYLPYRNTWFQSQTLNNSGLGSTGAFGAQVAMGDGLVAVRAPFTNLGEMFTPGAVFVFDRIGDEYTHGRAVFGAFDDERLTDMDMDGRGLIVGTYTNRFGRGSANVGRVDILEFQPSPESSSPSDLADADELADDGDTSVASLAAPVADDSRAFGATSQRGGGGGAMDGLLLALLAPLAFAGAWRRRSAGGR
jgi:hypothetical protein